MQCISEHCSAFEGGGPSHLYSADGEFRLLSVGLGSVGSLGESLGSGIGPACADE